MHDMRKSRGTNVYAEDSMAKLKTRYVCSECGYEHDNPEYTTPFCPGCGAKMDKEEEK